MNTDDTNCQETGSTDGTTATEEPGLDAAPDRHDRERCAVCTSTDVQGSFNGNAYCSTHLQERMARETGVGY